MSLIDELLSLEITPPVDTVKIGGKPVSVGGILNPTQMARLTKEGQGRKNLPVQIGEELVQLDEIEVQAYLWLIAGWQDAVKPTFEEIVTLSRKTGLDCMNAGQRVMELSGMLADEVDAVKNGSGEAVTLAP